MNIEEEDFEVFIKDYWKDRTVSALEGVARYMEDKYPDTIVEWKGLGEGFVVTGKQEDLDNIAKEINEILSSGK